VKIQNIAPALSTRHYVANQILLWKPNASRRFKHLFGRGIL